MKQQPAKSQRIPLGKPIEWSDQDLVALSAISPADLKAAAALWERDAPKKYKSLLQAEVIEREESK